MRKKIFGLFLLFIGVLFVGNNSAFAENYTLTVVGGYIEYIEGVELTGNPTTYTIAEGTKVNVYVNYKEGYYFDHWTYDRDVTLISDNSNCTLKFYMPSGNVTMTANNISKDKFTTIKATDTTDLDTTSFSNIDDFTEYEATFTMPNLGEISDTNMGSASATDLTFFKAVYYDPSSFTVVSEIEAGKTYIALLYFKLDDYKTFEYTHDGKYIYKVKSSIDVRDGLYGGSSSFPKNYLVGSVGTHVNTKTWSISVESGTYLHCYYKYMSLAVIFEVPSEFSVKFDNNGKGNNVAEQKVTANEKAVKPSDLTVDGYTFGGWYLDSECTKAFDFDTPIINNITLYAKWTKAYSYTFISGEKQEFTVSKGKNYTLKIDGDYTLFKSLTVNSIEFVKDVDYTVSEGSTIITFTNTGISKLNALKTGSYSVDVKYTNGKEVVGSLNIVDKVSNPGTYDGIITWVILSVLSIGGIIAIVMIRKKNRI